jgi:hypothetical protein
MQWMGIAMGLTGSLCALALTFAVAEPVEFDYPIYLTVGPDDTVYVSDQFLPAIYKFTKDGVASTIYQGRKNYRTPLNRPRGLAFGDGLVVADPSTMDVYRVADGKANPVTGKPVTLLNKMETTMGDLVQPEGVAIDKDGVIHVSDLRLRAICKIGKDNMMTRLAEIPAPRGIAFDKDGNLLVISHSNAQLKRVAPDGTVTDVIQARPFQFPLSICVRADGNYVVTDNYAKALWLVTTEGKASKLVEGAPLINPTGVGELSDGTLVVADPHAKTIFKVSKDNKIEPWIVGKQP